MTSFLPLKTYIFRVIDRFIADHNLTGPFLDAGCGQGDVALHLAGFGWSGLAVDASSEAIRRAVIRLKGTRVHAEMNDLRMLRGSFQTIVSCTVVEHVENDGEILLKFRDLLADNGFLILSVPTNPGKEWRWDDHFYGHYRRYTKRGLGELLNDCGFEILEFEDYTFPVFWLLRRIYTKIIPKKLPPSTIPEENSALSSLQDAWDVGPLSRWLARLPLWKIVFWIQHRFRQDVHGFEALVLARKRGTLGSH